MDIKFFLYNEKYKTTAKQLQLNDLKGLKYLDKTLPLAIFIHGFTDSALGPKNLSANRVRDGMIYLSFKFFCASPSLDFILDYLYESMKKVKNEKATSKIFQNLQNISGNLITIVIF